MGNSHQGFTQQRSQKFFTDLSRVNCTQNATGNVDDLNEKVQLKVSITKQTSGSTYRIQLFNVQGDSKISLNEPEELKPDQAGNLSLTTAILIQYYFEREQPLLVEITKNGIMQNFNTTLGCIMGSRKTTMQKAIPNMEGEELIIAAEKLKQGEDVFLVRFDIKPNRPTDFNKVSNKCIFEIAKNAAIYRSECLGNDGKFQPIKIPAGLINDRFSIIFYNYKRKVIFRLDTTMDELPSKSFSVKLSSKVNLTFYSKCYLTKNYSFVDYLKAGVQIGLSVAVDFTGSNGPPSDSRSLHYLAGGEPNQYERAILSCGSIVAYYDYDQMFPCYGFGAKIGGNVAHLFNLTLTDDPNVHLVSGIVDAYHNSVANVQLWGPTNFSPIIRATNEMIRKENDKLKYNILMILTDGMIDDIDDTIEALVDGSFLPLSVIIIGVGRANFASMDVLDADDNPLVNSRGVKAARDLVQFVPFLKYEANPQKLAQEVLAEVPKQILEYYEQNGIDPYKLTT